MKQNPIIDKLKLQMKIDPDFKISKSAILRTCFDPYCSEWNHSTLDQKTEALIYLREQGLNDSFYLAHSVFNYLTEKENKKIELIDVTMALGNLLDHMLENKMHSVKS